MQFRLVEGGERDAGLGGCEVVRVDQRVDLGKGFPLDYAAQEGFGGGSDLRRVDPDPPEEVPVGAEAGLVLQGLERVRATVISRALLDEPGLGLVRGADVQSCDVEQQCLETGKLRCQVWARPQGHARGNRVPVKEVVRPPQS